MSSLNFIFLTWCPLMLLPSHDTSLCASLADQAAELQSSCLGVCAHEGIKLFFLVSFINRVPSVLISITDLCLSPFTSVSQPYFFFSCWWWWGIFSVYLVIASSVYLFSHIFFSPLWILHISVCDNGSLWPIKPFYDLYFESCIFFLVSVTCVIHHHKSDNSYSRMITLVFIICSNPCFYWYSHSSQSKGFMTMSNLKKYTNKNKTNTVQVKMNQWIHH